MVILFKQDLKKKKNKQTLRCRTPEFLPEQVLLNDRKIRETIIWNHLSYPGFTSDQIHSIKSLIRHSVQLTPNVFQGYNSLDKTH